MKIAIFSPYLNTLGGGEKYMLTLAEVLSEDNKVHFLLGEHLHNIDTLELRKKIENLHSIDLERVSFVRAPMWSGGRDFFRRFWFLREYDCLFYLTDGSIFFSTAKKSFIHFQFPISANDASGWWGKLKLRTFRKAIYNSVFTQKFVEEYWPIKGEVVYPPVDIKNIKPLKKREQIISVGRFFNYLKTKNHKLLIEAFKDLIESKKAKGWSLHLVGASQESDVIYIEELKKLAKGYDVNIYPNLPINDLIKLYGESSIYWHAMGYGEENKMNFEHFGISTVEAMAAGCVPVVIGKGGQKEIVENLKSGFWWNTPQEMIDLTTKLILDKKLREEVSKEAIERAPLFGKENFAKKVKALIYEKP